MLIGIQFELTLFTQGTATNTMASHFVPINGNAVRELVFNG